jgi:hypothetical protein
MRLNLISESIEVFHGGIPSKGNIVTYYTTSEKMAKSYADMSNDRFGSGGGVHKSRITIENPAPESVINQIAQRLGMDIEHYTPASVFDCNLHDDSDVVRLVAILKKLGYDGAILDDIAYGEQIEEKAYITFS